MKRAIVIALIASTLLAAETAVRKFIPLPEPVNSPENDFAPSFTLDGNTMVFNSKRGNTLQDIYICHRTDGRWGVPRPIDAINSPFNDETPFITADGKVILFASDRDGSIEAPRDAQGRVRVSYDLYWAQFYDGAWTRPMRLPGYVNTAMHERAPSLGPDKRSLYYTAWPFGNPAASRIMRAEIAGNIFTNIKALPNPINTNHHETAFIPDMHGNGFYFSSTRGGGYGGWDIYHVEFKDGMWSTPVNLGPEVNSKQNDFFYTRIGADSYLCSDRPGGAGKYDIWHRAVPQGIPMAALVRNKATRAPMSSNVRIAARRPRQADAIDRVLSGRDGMLRHELPAETSAAEVTVIEPGYLPFYRTYSPEEIKKGLAIIELVPIEKDISFDVNEIYFDYNLHDIKEESFRVLDAVVEFMKKNPRVRFRVIGHTDLHGTPEYNLKLSLRRANAVREYLISKGIAERRLEIEGAGMSRPKINQKGREADEQNRRTEFKVIE